MKHTLQTWCLAGLAVVALSAVPAALETLTPSGSASADVCASAGRRISVSGCADLGDVMAPFVPPPAYYAPMAEDYPPPGAGVNACVGWNGRWISANTCN